ncbi:hypothetical protein GGS24DRAFT_504444 [Hypoxylon argillaceum]|nr:hypothetical protein GGS24DRAFT_504444 [Hypoxylon argillaceum]KAI1149939.1 hypothetical protein F4825DRAFT_452949 [Nemania diffusa]
MHFSLLTSLAALLALSSGSPTPASTAACPACDLACSRVIGNSIGVPQFCAIVNSKPLCVPSPSCGGFGGGIGGGTVCPTGFKCVADDVLGGSSKMCVPS